MALARRLAAVRWLDEDTRREALVKLSGLLPKVGFPDHWPTYESVRLSPTASLLANDLELNHRLWVIAGIDLGRPVDRGAWHMSPIEVNAYYTPLENSVVFPAGILRPPFFGLGFTEASNHGALGSMVGHELTHGFDDQGRQFDGSGALRNWWSAAVEGMFRGRAQCLVDQANAFEAVPGVRLDGRLSLGENIADLGGLKVAHDAFVARGAPGRRARGFDPRQQFFISYAQTWCENQRPELTATLLRVDPHAPAPYRVNGVLTNMSEFAAAFRCPVGSPLVSASPCEVW